MVSSCKSGSIVLMRFKNMIVRNTIDMIGTTIKEASFLGAPCDNWLFFHFQPHTVQIWIPLTDLTTPIEKDGIYGYVRTNRPESLTISKGLMKVTTKVMSFPCKGKELLDYISTYINMDNCQLEAQTCNRPYYTITPETNLLFPNDSYTLVPIQKQAQKCKTPTNAQESSVHTKK
jgi:hypothetical protein